MEETEFNDIVSKTVVPPHKPDFSKMNGVQRLQTLRKFIEKKLTIGIINIGMGNIGSISNAIYNLAGILN